MVNIQPGEAFVAGRSRSQAQGLLALAAERGLDPTVVRATVGGYVVPEALLEEPKTPKPKAPAKKRTRKPAANEEGS
jgi:hypothetical protein